jgi:hypothetical protein
MTSSQRVTCVPLSSSPYFTVGSSRTKWILSLISCTSRQSAPALSHASAELVDADRDKQQKAVRDQLQIAVNAE